jgi:hypothetical protein
VLASPRSELLTLAAYAVTCFALPVLVTRRRDLL